MQDLILQVIQDLNVKRLQAEEQGRTQQAEKLLTLSQGLKEVYL